VPSPHRRSPERSVVNRLPHTREVQDQPEEPPLLRNPHLVKVRDTEQQVVLVQLVLERPRRKSAACARSVHPDHPVIKAKLECPEAMERVAMTGHPVLISHQLPLLHHVSTGSAQSAQLAHKVNPETKD